MVEPTARMNNCSIEEIIDHLLFKRLDLDRNESTEETPGRIADALSQLTRGMREDASKHLTKSFPDRGYDQMVTMTDIEFYSLCEHHFLPFFGSCHVAYIPDESVTGLSKIPRAVQTAASRPTMQEALTERICNMIDEVLEPRGVMVVIEAQHLCMRMRGVEDTKSRTTTSSLRGLFADDDQTKSEFLDMIY